MTWIEFRHRWVRAALVAGLALGPLVFSVVSADGQEEAPPLPEDKIVVDIDAPDEDVSGSLSVLPGALLDAARRLSQQCSARGGQTLATFVGSGRGGIPVRPGASVYRDDFHYRLLC